MGLFFCLGYAQDNLDNLGVKKVSAPRKIPQNTSLYVLPTKKSAALSESALKNVRIIFELLQVFPSS
jgi:hypothetical protein